MLLIYSKIAYGVVIVNLVDYILSIIVAIVFKSEILEACKTLRFNDFSDMEQNDACNDRYNGILTYVIMRSVVTTLILVCINVYIYCLIFYEKFLKKKKIVLYCRDTFLS